MAFKPLASAIAMSLVVGFDAEAANDGGCIKVTCNTCSTRKLMREPSRFG
jgi:hypothetical protein